MKLMIQWAVTSSALILIVLTVRALFRDRLSARLRYALWGVVLLRLLVPFQVELPADTSAALPVLASNLAQDVTPRLDDTMLYAIPTEEQPYGLPAGMPPEYIRNGPFDSAWNRFSGGTVYDGEHVTRYAFMLTALEVVVLIWMAGTALAALVILTSNLRFSRRLRKRRERLEDIDSPVPVYTAEGLPSPCLFGVFRPAVYVTPEAAEDPDTLRHVLAHELTHHAHFDHLWSLLRCLALALHWYNPLVWLAVVLSKQDGELACDEGAVARLGEAERIPYGRTLVDMVAARSLRPGDLLSCSTAMTGGEKSTKRRVTQIVKKTETVKIALFAVIALVALGLVFTFAGRKDEPASPELDRFLSELESAQRIGIGNPLISSVFEPGNISAPETLAQAKELLSKTTPAAYLEDLGWDVLSLDSSHPPEYITQEELEGQFLIGGHPLNLFPTLDKDMETAHRCWLVWTEDCVLLTQWFPEREENTVEILAALPADTIIKLKELARTNGTSRPEEPASLYVAPNEDERVHPVAGAGEQSSLLGDLTQEQVDRANEAFRDEVKLPDGGWGSSEISCFFTSSYDDPTQIDLEEFLRYCPLSEEVNELTEQEEYRKVLEASFWAEEASNPDFLMPVPTWRYPREKVSALLQKYAGVTVDQLDWGNMLYLKEYDAFYNFTSDFGPGFFPCAGGQIMEDTVLLWSDPNENGDRCELTLRKDGENWLIQSHHTIYER